MKSDEWVQWDNFKQFISFNLLKKKKEKRNKIEEFRILNQVMVAVFPFYSSSKINPTFPISSQIQISPTLF